MIERSNNEERQRLLAGDEAASLGPDEAVELAMLTDVLGDESTWAEPRATLEDAIVQAIAAAPAESDLKEAQAARRRRPSARRWFLAPAAAAAAIAVVALVGSVGGDPSADFTAQLAATQLVPGARASAAVTRNEGGFRIALRASGLSSLPDGQYYEAWLKNSSGTSVPVGTFSSSSSPVTLWSGVSPADFPTMTITIELDDNNQASSGRVVLVGEARAER